jgi:hypothetical protein
MVNLNLNNLFEFCNDSIELKNISYCIGNLIGNSLLTLAIKNDNGYIMSYSSEWLYLIKSYYPNSGMYNEIVNFYYNILNKKYKVENINENTLSLITCFSAGTVHGYAGLFNILCEYVDNYDKYKNYKLLVYNESQTGILNIIDHLCDKNIIDRSKIIFLNKNVIYNINSLYIIPNNYHIFNNILAEKVSIFIEKNISFDKNKIKYYSSLHLSKNIKNICIIKGTNSVNLTNDGIFQTNNITNFCNKWNLTLVEPNKLNEIYLIYYINQCKNLIISWGTSFFKNYVYISNNCEKIIILIMKNSNFETQYNSHKDGNILLKEFKNAKVIYKIIDPELNFNPFS